MYGNGQQARDFHKGFCTAVSVSKINHKVHGQISINCFFSNITNNLRYQDEKYICIACGFMAEKKITKLKLPCPRVAEARTSHGKSMLKRFVEGQTCDPCRVVSKTSSSLSPQEAVALRNVQSSVNDIQSNLLQIENESNNDGEGREDVSLDVPDDELELDPLTDPAGEGGEGSDSGSD